MVSLRRTSDARSLVQRPLRALLGVLIAVLTALGALLLGAAPAAADPPPEIPLPVVPGVPQLPGLPVPPPPGQPAAPVPAGAPQAPAVAPPPSTAPTTAADAQAQARPGPARRRGPHRAVARRSRRGRRPQAGGLPHGGRRGPGPGARRRCQGRRGGLPQAGRRRQRWPRSRAATSTSSTPCSPRVRRRTSSTRCRPSRRSRPSTARAHHTDHEDRGRRPGADRRRGRRWTCAGRRRRGQPGRAAARGRKRDAERASARPSTCCAHSARAAPRAQRPAVWHPRSAAPGSACLRCAPPPASSASRTVGRGGSGQLRLLRAHVMGVRPGRGHAAAVEQPTGHGRHPGVLEQDAARRPRLLLQPGQPRRDLRGRWKFINAPESGDVVRYQSCRPPAFSGARRL